MVANGQSVSSVYNTSVFVRFRDIQRRLVLRVVEDSAFPTLLGRDWMIELFGEDWFERLIRVNKVETVEQTRLSVIEKLKASPVFQPGVGSVEKHVACFDLKQDYRPKFCKARPVGYAEKDEIGAELDRLVEVGYYVPVDSSEWASPVVPVRKTDGSIRLCGDYKRTLNPNLDMMIYPLPVVEDCFVEMKGGQLFSKIDIKQAYNSLPLREQDQILATINTHQGLYKPLVLPYGVTSACGIFQSTIDKELKGLKHVTCRVDDILITGKTTPEHIATLLEVVRRLEVCGFKCRWDKSKFLEERVIYLGYEISKEGVRPCRSKIETLAKAPYPDNLEALISFLGAAQYYSRFIQNMATLIEPLNRLRTSEWKFGPEEKASFDELKKKLISNDVLIFYDPRLPLRIDCDASSYGLGACLSHVDQNGVDRPIEFISRTLSPTERRYSQIDREALSIVWSVKRFHRYVYARPFELLTDHQPLEYIYATNKGIPEMGTSRVQRWAVTLSTYQFSIRYRPTKKHSNADVCSRFPLPVIDDGCSVEIDGLESKQITTVFAIQMNDDKPLLNAELMAKCTKKDPCLAKILYYVREGWPVEDKKKVQRPITAPENAAESDESSKKKVQRPITAPENAAESEESSEFRAFYNRRSELSVEQNCLLWGNRVVVPEILRADVLKVLHSTHMGMTVMKQLARNYLWWPKLDADIEAMVKRCEVCQLCQRLPNKAVPHPWVRSQNPWERIHIDYAGPFKNCMWLIVVDSYSKWIEIINMRNNTTALNTIRKLRVLFSRYGLVKILVSDNGPQLVKSHEFEQYCKKSGINHVPIPSYHPASNGQAESIVGKFKAAMRKMCKSDVDIEMNLASWLLNYHNTPHSATGIEPSVLMLGRRLRSPLSLVNPLSSSSTLQQQVHTENEKIKSEKTLRRFAVGDPVLYRDVLGKTWCRGTVRETSDKLYVIITESGSIVKKHIDHVVASTSVPATNAGEKVTENSGIRLGLEARESGKETTSRADPSLEVQFARPMHAHVSTLPRTGVGSIDPSCIAMSRPKRVSRQPDRLGYEVLGGQNPA